MVSDGEGAQNRAQRLSAKISSSHLAGPPTHTLPVVVRADVRMAHDFKKNFRAGGSITTFVGRGESLDMAAGYFDCQDFCFPLLSLFHGSLHFAVATEEGC